MTFTLNHEWRQRKFIVKKEAITQLTVREAFLMTCFISRLGSNEKDFRWHFFCSVSRHRRSAFFASALTSIIHYFKRKIFWVREKRGRKSRKDYFCWLQTSAMFFTIMKSRRKRLKAAIINLRDNKITKKSFILKSSSNEPTKSCLLFHLKRTAAKKIEISLTRLMSGCSLINDLVSAENVRRYLATRDPRWSTQLATGICVTFNVIASRRSRFFTRYPES